ncbi:MAG: hypothetical protein J6B26_09210 [Agathobacter sp.]|nr:hypothetical protein [Agathobacter sp.]
MIVIVGCLMIGVVSAGSFLAKDREFSENENRYLAETPEFSWEKVLEGEFQEDLESYLNDQILGRDFWITAKTSIQKFIGDSDIGGAYVGKDGYDFEKIIPESVDEDLFVKNTVAVKDYLDYCKNQGIEESQISFLLVPTSGLVMEDKLPANARLFDQEKYLEEAKATIGEQYVVDVTKELQEAAKTEQVYYRTDHHWTSTGALIAYEKWCSDTGMAFLGREAYQQKNVTDTFRGSLYSKILDYDSAYDSIWTYAKDENADYTITIDGEEAESFYVESKLEEKDKYTYFFGGNYGETIITNNGNKNGRRLLVIKDSFANCFVPLAAEDFEEIYMIDLRYCKEDMAAYVKDKGVTDVLILYNISNFITDKNIYQLDKNL